jgi:predicted nucleotidyltransferase
MVTSTERLLSKKILQEATRRIVDVAKPKRILLFGSAVNGRMTPDSDLDMLVVVSRPVHRRQMAQKINRNLHGLGISVDIVVVTEEDIKKYGQRLGTILRPALMGGHIIYEA